MKLQLSGQHLRVRIDETELAALQAGLPVENTTRLDSLAWQHTVHAVDGVAATLRAESGASVIGIPRAMLDGYAARLPCRDGLELSLQPADGPALAMVLEVDVRDSIRRRGPRKP